MSQVLSIISGVPGIRRRRFGRRGSLMKRFYFGRKLKRSRRILGCTNGIGGSNIFHCPTEKNSIDKSTHHRYRKSDIERHKRINQLMNTLKVHKLKFKSTVKRKKAKGIVKSRNKRVVMNGLLGFRNLLGVKKMKKKSLGMALAKRKKVSAGKCRKVGRRKVCRTKRGKAYIRRDVVGRKHNSMGRFSLRGFGLGGFGAFKGDSCAHRVIRSGYGGFRKLRKSRSHSRLGNFGIGALPLPASVKSFLPPINKETMMKSLSIIGGAVTPLTVQNLVIPAKWRTGIMGMLSYTVIGGTLIAATSKVNVLKSRSTEISQGVVLGFVWQFLQNYIFKRSLIPVSAKRPTALKGVDACASCSNAGDCAEVGSCLGYFDGTGDDVDGIDEDVDGTGDDVDGLDDYLQLEDSFDGNDD